ncbi:MAG TPA: hypothetical protein VH253_18625 [Phycisphaerae bacterium]|nr:hypothetical protein [Phycisphaerae bacterium]
MPIFADYHRTVIGYHGTRQDRALEIVSGRAGFAPSVNAWDWLGHGVYFWEYAPQQAWRWAKQRYAGEEIGVVASMIRLGNCLDLVDPRNAAELVNRHRRLVDRIRKAGGRVPVNVRSKKYLDCAVLEFAYATLESEWNEQIDSSRGVYVPTGGQSQRRLWAGSWLCHNTHVQLCVRNTQNILGTWLVKRVDQNEG